MKYICHKQKLYHGGIFMSQNLSAYRIFYTVANAKNISKAARELFISQPAISKSIQKLEDSLGCRLFIRSSKGVALTEEGNLLYSYVKDAFDALSLGEKKLRRSIELGAGHLNIGVSSTLCKYILLPYLKEFIRLHPYIRISITCQSTNETLKLLEEDKIDIGLVGKPEETKNIQFDFLEEIEDIFVAAKDYLRHLKARGIPKHQILSHSTLMLLDPHNMTRQYIDDYLRSNQIQIQDFLEISDMDLLIEFAKIGVGIACVIRSFVQHDLECGSLAEVPLKVPIRRRQVGFVYKKQPRMMQSLTEFICCVSSFHSLRAQSGGPVTT